MTDPLLGVCESCLNEVLDADLADGLCPVCREAAASDAGEPVPAEPDLSAELLAARLEVERLRRVLSVARPRIAECIDEDEDSGGEMASSEAYERCLAEIDGALAAPPPDLAPLRELFLRVDRVLCGDALGADEVRLTALRVARDVAAEAFPSLPYPALAGEG